MDAINHGNHDFHPSFETRFQVGCIIGRPVKNTCIFQNKIITKENLRKIVPYGKLTELLTFGFDNLLFSTSTRVFTAVMLCDTSNLTVEALMLIIHYANSCKLIQ